jgi:hypothetical protein
VVVVSGSLEQEINIMPIMQSAEMRMIDFFTVVVTGKTVTRKTKKGRPF